MPLAEQLELLKQCTEPNSESLSRVAHKISMVREQLERERLEGLQRKQDSDSEYSEEEAPPKAEPKLSPMKKFLKMSRNLEKLRKQLVTCEAQTESVLERSKQPYKPKAIVFVTDNSEAAERRQKRQQSAVDTDAGLALPASRQQSSMDNTRVGEEKSIHPSETVVKKGKKRKNSHAVVKERVRLMSPAMRTEEKHKYFY